MSLENKLEQATGAVKEGFGKVTGDSKTELKKQLLRQKTL